MTTIIGTPPFAFEIMSKKRQVVRRQLAAGKNFGGERRSAQTGDQRKWGDGFKRVLVMS
jgi:hypothetical protein